MQVHAYKKKVCWHEKCRQLAPQMDAFFIDMELWGNKAANHNDIGLMNRPCAKLHYFALCCRSTCFHFLIAFYSTSIAENR